jgi:pimeloyl-ACP methyl ester carboxylesterase
MAAAKPATFLLIHGAWHGGWCWRRVSDLLTKKGHRVFAPTLSGVGERAHQFRGDINLTTHIEDVLGVVKWEDLSNFVLCGHSYGGMVITGVADRIPDKIGSLVYLDAFIPEDGQSLFDQQPEDRRPGVINGAGAAGGLAVPPMPAAFFKVNARDADWVNRQCTPQPLGTLIEKIKLTGAHKRVPKKTYILAGDYAGPVFSRTYERLKSDKAWTAHSVPSGHDVMLDQPEKLAELLEAAI